MTPEATLVLTFRRLMRYAAPSVSIVAIPNAAKRGPKASAQAKAEGMAPGFPDVQCMWDGGIAFIEFKTVKGKLSANQAEWLDRLTAMGFPASVQRDPEAAVDWLRGQGAPVRAAT